MDFDAYKNTLPYPAKTDFTTTYWYSGGKCRAVQKGRGPITDASGRIGIDESTLKGMICERVLDEAALSEGRRVYGAEEQRIMAQFKLDLFADLGITSHPMREKLFSKAWEDGHSSGYQEVYNCASNLTDLIDIPTGYVLVGPNCAVFGGAMLRKATDLVDQLAKELAK